MNCLKKSYITEGCFMLFKPLPLQNISVYILAFCRGSHPENYNEQVEFQYDGQALTATRDREPEVIIIELSIKILQ